MKVGTTESLSTKIFPNWAALTVLFAIAFLLRLAAGVWFGLDAPPLPGSDAAEYDQYAWNLVQGRGYRGKSPDVSDSDHLTAYRTPGTSLFWGALYATFGHRYDVVRVANCVLGALSSLLLLQIGRFSFGQSVGWTAATLWAFFPTSIFFSAQLFSEPLLLALFLGFLIVSLNFSVRPQMWRAMLAGFLLGMTLLVHPSKVVMLPLVLVWSVWQFRNDRKVLLLSLIILVMPLAVLSPWTIRNYVVFGQFIPFSTMGGSVLLQGNNRLVVSDPALHGYVIWDTKIPEYADMLRQPNDEVARDRVAKKLAVQWLLDNTDKWLFLAVAKLQRGLTPFLQPKSPAYERYVMLWSWGPVLLLSAVAYFPTWILFIIRRQPAWLIHLAILHFLLITVIFFGYTRYRYVIEPLCILLASKAFLFLITTPSEVKGYLSDGSRDRTG